MFKFSEAENRST